MELVKITSFDVKAAIYQIIHEKDNLYLLGLGLWDRENEPHSLEVKNNTPGQVIRIGSENEIIARSPELDNIVYQLEVLDDGKIFVGTRSGKFYYLNSDLSINKKIDIDTNGFYFWHRLDKTIICTTRDGGIAFFDTTTDTLETINLVDKDVRMWALYIDETNSKIVCGSYAGDLILLDLMSRKVIQKTKIAEKRNSVWAIEKFMDKYFVGTANGDVFLYDNDLKNRKLIYKNNVGITAVTKWNDMLLFGDHVGDLAILNVDESVKKFEFNMTCKTPNTIWWIDADIDHDAIRVAYSNGTLETFFFAWWE